MVQILRDQWTETDPVAAAAHDAYHDGRCLDALVGR